MFDFVLPAGTYTLFATWSGSNLAQPRGYSRSGPGLTKAYVVFVGCI